MKLKIKTFGSSLDLFRFSVHISFHKECYVEDLKPTSPVPAVPVWFKPSNFSTNIGKKRLIAPLVTILSPWTEMPSPLPNCLHSVPLAFSLLKAYCLQSERGPNFLATSQEHSQCLGYGGRTLPNHRSRVCTSLGCREHGADFLVDYLVTHATIFCHTSCFFCFVIILQLF